MMKYITNITFIIFLFYFFINSVNCETLTVSNAKDLVNALETLKPGDTILLSDGDYRGKFIATTNGTPDEPITISGSRNATLRGYSYGFWLQADYWIVQGFTVYDSLKGIVVEGANYNILEDLEIRDISQEAVHFRYNSNGNILSNCYIHHTGQRSHNDEGFGEGVYVGSAVSHWLNGEQDKSDENQILDNVIGPNVTAEAVDIKEGSCCGVVRGNVFQGPQTGVNYADSWIDLKGDNYLIEDNVGYDSLLDGFQIHHISDAGIGGCNNIIRNNQCHGIPEGGQCVNDSSKCENEISDNDTD